MKKIYSVLSATNAVTDDDAQTVNDEIQTKTYFQFFGLTL